MLKIRYLVVTFFAYYLISVLMMVAVESFLMGKVIKDIQADIRTAGDIALEYTQHVDDFLAFRQEDAYRLPMSIGGSDFRNSDVFESMYGLTVQSENDLEQVYDKLYNNAEFRRVMALSEPIRVPVRYYSGDINSFTTHHPEMVWYSIPRALTLGGNFLQGVPEVQKLRKITGGESGTEVPNLVPQVKTMYGINEHVREVTDENGDSRKYFNTPLNNGLTYINRELVSAMFSNVMDLQMRMKYNDKDFTTSTLGCHGKSPDNPETRSETFVCGSTYNHLSYGADLLDAYNPVSNGIYTYLRHDEVSGTGQAQLYTGTPTAIEYKVIDMHNPANESLLVSIWGNKKKNNNENGVSINTSTKAQYFKELNKQKQHNFETDLQGFYDKYPILVAKVTFKADIIIPYVTPTLRGLVGEFARDRVANYLDVVPLDNAPTGALGSRRFEYTTFFAVAP